ncbi:MAG: hypothetical protein ABFS18_00530 [Thermodesulfobacteriota bacterium]
MVGGSSKPAALPAPLFLDLLNLVPVGFHRTFLAASRADYCGIVSAAPEEGGPAAEQAGELQVVIGLCCIQLGLPVF